MQVFAVDVVRELHEHYHIRLIKVKLWDDPQSIMVIPLAGAYPTFGQTPNRLNTFPTFKAFLELSLFMKPIKSASVIEKSINIDLLKYQRNNIANWPLKLTMMTLYSKIDNWRNFKIVLYKMYFLIVVSHTTYKNTEETCRHAGNVITQSKISSGSSRWVQFTIFVSLLEMWK